VISALIGGRHGSLPQALPEVPPVVTPIATLPEAEGDNSRSWWSRLKSWLCAPQSKVNVMAVCVPPGARLRVSQLSSYIQRQFCLGAVEEVTFTELSAAAYECGPAWVSEIPAIEPPATSIVACARRSCMGLMTVTPAIWKRPSAEHRGGPGRRNPRLWRTPIARPSNMPKRSQRES
jgi:hypothetical protein